MTRTREADAALEGMLGRAVALEQRVQRLRREGRPPRSLWTRVTDALARTAPTLSARRVLTQLSEGLSRLGVHTLADAQLLRRALEDARARTLATRLGERCERGLAEAEAALRQVERVARRGAPVPDGARLEAEVSALLRVLRLVAVLREPPVPLSVAAAEGEGTWRTHQEIPARRGFNFSTPHLAIAAALEAKARTATLDPGPRRVELEVAHALLLNVEPDEEERPAALQLRWRVVQAREALAKQGTAETLEGLLREIRGLARREPQSAYQRLRGVQQKARLDGRHDVADAAGRALELLAGPAVRWGPDASQVERAFGLEPEGMPEDVREGKPIDPLSVALFGQSLGRDPERTHLLNLARGAARFVEVEHGPGVDGDIAGRELGTASLRAEWPMARLELERTDAPSRARDFVIEDPRRILLDLASGRQQVRVFVEPSSDPAPRRRSGVRIYVCDASRSMQGARARFRDALVLAELESVLLRAHRGLPVDPLYYCHFTDRPGPLQRVDDGSAALRHIDRLLTSTPASGRTDITLALLAAFDVIAEARGRDPALARASVVLVTDGEDTVDPAAILRAREPLRALPISLSFISLGQENPALRELARTQQRDRGARAFYLHLSDLDLRWAGDAFSAPVRTLAPEDWSPDAVDTDALEPYLVALEEVAAGHVIIEPPLSEAAFDARFPPSPRSQPRAAVLPLPASRVKGILAALEETVALLPLDRRASECVWLLDHLLALHGETLPAWQAALGEAGTEAAAALGRLRLLTRRPGWAGTTSGAAPGGGRDWRAGDVPG